MKQTRAGFWRRHRWLKWVLSIAAAGLAMLTVVALVVAHRAEPILRATIIRELEEHFNAHVELDSFHVALRNGLWAEGKGLRIWPPADVEGGTSAPGGQPSAGGQPPSGGQPLIRLDEFRFHTPLHYDPKEPIRISVVQLRGLSIDMPPRANFERGAKERSEPETSPPAKAALGLLQFVIQSVVCDDARLTIETNKPAAAGMPARPPLQFAITHLRLTGISPGQPMGFEAELTNPRPMGVVRTKGRFGPWLVSDPGESPIDGSYTFNHADLSTFKGIAGILDSTGHYSGTLRNMTVDGETDTPDFHLTHFGTALPLHTKFHALVDGTNGDTQLDPVDAVLDHSHFSVRGQVVRAREILEVVNGQEVRGHETTLTINVDQGRIEDFLRLASRSGTPLLTGALALKGDIKVPPGTETVERRMKLKGTFALDDAQFTSAKVQDKIGDLSSRGLGHPKEARGTSGAEVRSAMTGSFLMENGEVTLPQLEYTVPGAVIDLKGTYGVEKGELQFAGTARMQATVSQMVGGWKGLLIKPLDRYFRKDGAGTEVPIHISGTRDNPQFGVDLDRMKKTSPERPDEPR